MATWTSLQTGFGTGLSVSSFATDLDDNLYMMDASGDVFEYKISTDTLATINTTASMDIDRGIVWFDGNLYMLADQSGSPEVFQWDGTPDSRTSVKTLTAGKDYWLVEDGTTMVAVCFAASCAAEYTTDGASWSSGPNLPGNNFWNGFPQDIDTRGNEVRIMSGSGGVAQINKWNSTSWTQELSSGSLAFTNEWKTDEDFLTNARYWNYRGHVPVEHSTDFITWTEADNAETGEYTFYLDEYGLFTKTYGVNGDVGGGGTQCEFCEYNEVTGLFDVIDTAFSHIYQASTGHTVPLINIPTGATSPGTYLVLYSTSFTVWKRSAALSPPATAYGYTHSAGGMPGTVTP